MKGRDMEEILLGFQLKAELKKIKEWELDRRKAYLLREDIKMPLSVDQAVWAESDKNVYSSLFSDYCEEVYSSPNGLNIYNIKSKVVLDQASFHDGAILIGLTVVNDIESRAQELKNKHFMLNMPYSIKQLLKANWICLGYDVADYWPYSGLMNCGYNADDKVALSKRFTNALNEYGLFNLIETAQEFGIDCETRVKEHAPFAIYGMWWKK